MHINLHGVERVCMEAKEAAVDTPLGDDLPTLFDQYPENIRFSGR
jgi:hypothetical protein